MKTLVLFGFMAAPFLLGGIAVGNTEGSANLCAAMFFSIWMIRESTRICLLLMQRWQMFEHPLAWTFPMSSHFTAAELRPARIRAEGEIYRRDIYHRR